MRTLVAIICILTLLFLPFTTASGSTHHHSHGGELPDTIVPLGEKVIIVDPNIHEWGAYDPDGKLIRTGLATAGSSWCRDLHHPCRTKSGSFRIYSLGGSDCISHKFPLYRG